MLSDQQYIARLQIENRELAWALLHIMDGVKPHEIQEMTGLPELDCVRIAQIRDVALEQYSWLLQSTTD